MNVLAEFIAVEKPQRNPLKKNLKFTQQRRKAVDKEWKIVI